MTSLGFRVVGLGFRVKGVGLRAEGVGFRVLNHLHRHVPRCIKFAPDFQN